MVRDIFPLLTLSMDTYPNISLSNCFPNFNSMVHITNLCFSTGNLANNLKSDVVQPLIKETDLNAMHFMSDFIEKVIASKNCIVI